MQVLGASADDFLQDDPYPDLDSEEETSEQVVQARDAGDEGNGEPPLPEPESMETDTPAGYGRAIVLGDSPVVLVASPKPLAHDPAKLKRMTASSLDALVAMAKAKKLQLETGASSASHMCSA